MRDAFQIAIILCIFFALPLKASEQDNAPKALSYISNFSENFVIFHTKEPIFNTNWAAFDNKARPRPFHFQKQDFLSAYLMCRLSFQMASLVSQKKQKGSYFLIYATTIRQK